MIAFHLLGRPIYRYGLFYVISFLVICFFVRRSSQYLFHHAQNPIEKKYTRRIVENRENCAIRMMWGMLIGGRMGYVVFYDYEYFFSHPEEIIAVWKGGMSYMGGIIGVTSAAFLYAWKKKWSLSDLLSVTDFFCAIIPFGSILGRRGNFLNQELYGRIFTDVFPHTRLPFAQKFFLAVQYSNVDSLWRINTSLVASMSEGLFLLCLVQYVFWTTRKIPKKFGYVTRTFLGGYSCIRFVLEYIRQDSYNQQIFGLSTTQRIIICGRCLFLIFFMLWHINVLSQHGSKK